MGIVNLDQNIHYVPLFNYAAKTTTSYTAGINMKLYEKVQFYIKLEATTVADQTVTVTQRAAVTAAAGTAIATHGYRVSATAGTDTMGATTAFTTSGLAITYSTYDNLTVIIDVDSSDMVTEALPYVGLDFTRGGSASAYMTIWALCWPKYPKETNASALT